MSPRVNLMIQIAAVLVSTAFRFAAPGWWLLILVLTVVGAAVVLLPTFLAVATVRRARLAWPVAVPFLASAAFLVVAGAFFPGPTIITAPVPAASPGGGHSALLDFDDQRSYIPLMKILGLDGDANGLPAGIGGVAVLGFILCAAVTPVVVGVTAVPSTPGVRPRPRVATR